MFSEPGASALDDGRPVFQEMIYKANAPTGHSTLSIVHSRSCFSRDALHSKFIVRQLRKAGVQLVSITQDIGNDTMVNSYAKFSTSLTSTSQGRIPSMSTFMLSEPNIAVAPNRLLQTVLSFVRGSFRKELWISCLGRLAHHT